MQEATFNRALGCVGRVMLDSKNKVGEDRQRGLQGTIVQRVVGREGLALGERTGSGEAEGSRGRVWASLLPLPSSRQLPLSPSSVLALLPVSPPGPFLFWAPDCRMNITPFPPTCGAICSSQGLFMASALIATTL